jgi:hexosaminidase
MKVKQIFLVTVCALGLQTVFAQTQMQRPPSIIPEPQSVLLHQGAGSEAPFLLTARTVLVAPDKEAQNAALYLQQYVERFYRFRMAILEVEPLEEEQLLEQGILLVVHHEAAAPQGAYRMEVTARSITLTGANPQGLFYAVQTLIQLLPTKPFTGGHSHTQLPIPALSITDAPRFAYRGLHLDVVRHIFPIEYIKRYIDYMALHKLNYFHWHLTDDQGWRMESRRHPLLNEKSAYRQGTIIGIFPGTGVDSTRYGGYYTIEQMKEVVAYAAERYITVIPEIDIPGHCMAVLAAYPHFSTTPELPKMPPITWGIFNRQNNVLAPTDEVFAFLKDVFEELIEVFPSPYIHLGGDECAKKWWQESALTQEFIKKHGLNNEEELQSFFIHFVSDIILSKGRTPIGWNEVMQGGGAPKETVVMSWQNIKAGIEAAKLGHQTIMTPIRYCYMNISQLKEEKKVLVHGGYTPIDSVYAFDPVPKGTKKDVAVNIIGGQLCMWTEYYPIVEHIEYALFPRLAAASEVFWSARERRNFPLFLERLERQKERYVLWGIHFCDVEE